MPGITNPAEEYFKDGLWGWDGSAWRKLPMVWGYSDRLRLAISGTAAGAGDATAITGGVPDGEVWVVETVNFYHDAGADKAAYVWLTGEAVFPRIVDQPVAVSGTYYFWQGRLVMKKDDTLRTTVTAPGDGKKVFMSVFGYKMKVAE